MDAEYARSYRQLYETHWWWRARERFLVKEIARRWRGRPDGAILDVGCGSGLFFDALSRFGAVEGVEPTPEMLIGNTRYRDRIFVGPFERFAPDKQYDLILLLDVLEHLQDAGGALVHAKRLLRRDGCVIITVPAFNLLWTSHDELNQHVTRYTRASFRSVTDAAGLRINDARYFFHWLYLAKLVLRAAEWIVPRDPIPTHVPPSIVNRSLRMMCQMEQLVLGWIPVPFGNSLLIVAGHGNER